MAAINVTSVLSAVESNVISIALVGGAVLLVVFGARIWRWLRVWYFSGPSPESVAYTAKVKAQIRRLNEQDAAEKAAEAAKSPDRRTADEALRVAQQAKALAEWNYFRGD